MSPSITNQMESFGLNRSNSRATTRSTGSAKTFKSSKSCQSVAAIGDYKLGSLRVHSADIPEEGSSPACLQNGDVLIITGSVQPGAILGYDLVSFTVRKGGEFHGIRELPFGAHFVYGGSPTSVAGRNGYWFMTPHRATGEPGDIYVKRWDHYNELLDDEPSIAETRIQQEGVEGIYDKLLPYDLAAVIPASRRGENAAAVTIDLKQLWRDMICGVKGNYLTRTTGGKWNEWKVEAGADSKPPASLVDVELQRVAAIDGDEQKLKFVFDLGERTFSTTAVGGDRTAQALDTSAYLREIIRDRCEFADSDWIIGEMQFAYICGVHLGNISCIEQWEHVLKIVFKAYRVSIEEPVLYTKIIRAFHAQLIHNDAFLEDEGSIFATLGGFKDELRMILTLFKSRLTEQILAQGEHCTPQQLELGNAFERLEQWLWKWDWDLRGNFVKRGPYQLEDGEVVDLEMEEFDAEDDRGEYAPVIVEMDEDGREKDLISW